MHDSPNTPGAYAKPGPGPVRRLIHWMKRRRRAALALALQGACYSAGTTAVGILGVWVQHRL
ncbi:hypothetical protein ACFQ7N_10500 [Streptomyces niveus]|uniref:hypothetical protein n=1 Tax=Streptomyces niveus TaxID=193462 RepID=UPI0036ABDB57